MDDERGVRGMKRSVTLDLMPWRMMDFAEGGPHEFPAPVGGCYWREGDTLYLPFITTRVMGLEGRGIVGMILARAMETMRAVKVPTVISARLDGMLDRRGFTTEWEYSTDFAEDVEIRVWRRIVEKREGEKR